ncbi:hypothetical protein OD91_0875 [Lutibacter sp. Hel_I_33_5]|uniref:hypothetical protein n=1 Tax=Lutibacter sp. Hel_I_33_5 TaxID=1566289 RepID=UPI0011A7911D|nr:hypothetical protein [Lutibacter sp. Hel_I_33_5]TVZ55620.1 hypothetical protein OD91_0875 [Lutibacter sp. Hel_I_33_5]
MNIAKNIENAIYFIDVMKSDLETVKSAKQRDFKIDMINAFIVLINTIEALQDQSKLLKVIDSLLLERMYRDMFRYAAEGVPMHLSRIFYEIRQDIQNPLSAQKEKLVSFLFMEELTYLVNNNRLTDETVKSASGDGWSVLVDEKLNEFKEGIQWN